MMGQQQQQQQTIKRAAKKGVGTLFSRTLWLARGTSTVLGLALMMTLMVGVASAVVSAPAEAAPASTLKAGVQNAVSAVTSMVGSVAGPILKLDNNGAGTALDLQVESGKAPMTVNSETKVDNLNADKIDTLDSSALVRSSYYNVASSTGYEQGSYYERYYGVGCDAGDIALSGGFGSLDEGTQIMWSSPTATGTGTPLGWSAQWKNDSTLDTVLVYAMCADVGTPRQ